MEATGQIMEKPLIKEEQTVKILRAFNAPDLPDMCIFAYGEAPPTEIA